MNTELIKNWLATEHNAFFFQNEANARAIEGLYREYLLVKRTLSELLKSADMTRDSYLEWVKLWKATYAKISFEIRTSKNNRKENVHGSNLAWANQSNASSLRPIATELLELRSLSKALARASYTAHRDGRLSMIAEHAAA